VLEPPKKRGRQPFKEVKRPEKKAEVIISPSKPGKSRKGLSTKERTKLIVRELLAMTDKYDGRRKIVDLFMDLPDQEEYADYYEAIPKPICLRDIISKVQKDENYSLIDMEKDITLLCGNAQSYNMKNSQIYSDSETIFHEFKRLKKVNGNTVQIQEPNDNDQTMAE
jgi:hypothetical protein